MPALALLCLAPPVLPAAQRIENAAYRIEVDSRNGVIRSIFDKVGQTELIGEPRLAENFRLLLPLPDLEGNYILGKDQRLTSLKRTPGGLELFWAGPLENPRGRFGLSVTMQLDLGERGLQFRMQAINRTEYKLAEVWYPVLGGLTGFGSRDDTREIIPYRGWLTATRLFRHFVSMSGLGIPEPEVFWDYPRNLTMPWADIYNPKLNRGLYFAAHDPIHRVKALRFELHPGMADRQGDNWPRRDELEGDTPVGVVAHWAYFPYTQPGETFEGPPAVLRFHAGDWHEGARIYREWFQSQFTLTDPRKSWLHREMGFQDTMFLLPEGNVLWRFKDIPRWAKDALNYGVASLLISGWNVGGHDGGYPEYSPDPRLGTWEELAAGIRAAHELGAKVFFFANVQPVETDTDWYRKELHRYLTITPRGEAKRYGWGMGSLGARLGYTRRPLASASPGIPEFRAIIVRQMERLARAGADGVHLDKLCASGLDFNPLLKLSPDRAIPEGQLLALHEMLAACRAVNPHFALSVECPCDRTLEYTEVGWSWHPVAGDHDPVFKFTFSQYLPGLAISQPYDYTAVNNAVRYGYQMLIGPGNYTQSMQYEPFRPLARYIREVLRIRKELEETIYWGEFLDTFEARFEGAEHTRYSVFRNASTGKRAAVLVNLGESARKASLLAFMGNQRGRVRIHAPFTETKTGDLPVVVTIPAERFVIVAEE